MKKKVLSKVIAVALPPDVHEYVSRRAAAESMTISTLVRRVLVTEMVNSVGRRSQGKPC